MLHSQDDNLQWSTRPVSSEAGSTAAEEGSDGITVAGLELRLARAECDLREAQRRLRLHTESGPLALIEWRATDLAVSVWSPRAAALFGWSEREARAMEAAQWRFTHPADGHVAAAALALRGVAESADAEGFLVLQARNYTRDGRILHCEWYNVVLTDSEGRAQSVVSLVHDITPRVRAEAEKSALLAQQTRIAETLQRSLLLMPSAPLLPGLDLAHFYAPALDEALVGGDFYDAFVVNRHRAALVVGDVTGKGLEAAAYMAETKFALRALLREHLDPSVALGHLNRFYIESVRLDEPTRTAFVCVTLAVFDRATSTLEVAVAGADPPILVRIDADSVRSWEIPAEGALLGTDPSEVYESVRWPLQPGDVLCMSTDGISEARRVRYGSGESTPVRYYEFFGTSGIRRVMEKSLETDGSLHNAAARLTEAARDFAGGVLTDDACLLIARWEPE